ncbi:hypothetical protein QBC43DRAFT_319138 [Cladorrhinum sp. PSN259]|nr:hypothetical protein QBC43DRAFT_319138 [Cladorrhinum sp. PSN259]
MSFKIERFTFTRDALADWRDGDEKHYNWPTVYVLDDGKVAGNANNPRDIYVGESLNLASRLRQHLDTPAKQHLQHFRPIINPRYNKSVCLDLESYLIRMLAGDGANRVLNRNNGITETKYYQHEMYRDGFANIFEQLRADGLFTRSIPEIENSDLFKLSPFKALTQDQADSVEEIVKRLLAGLEQNTKSTIVIQGDPGTGKTVAAIYLVKLLRDVGSFTSLEDLDSDLRFSEFFTIANRNLLQNCRIGLVVPQQSLRASIKKVFKSTPGLHSSMVMTPFEVGKSDDLFDVLLVDEAHRLNQRANQSSARQNKDFGEITEKLFGTDDLSVTQLDWIKKKSKHQIFLVDTEQSVRPADLPSRLLSTLIAEARGSQSHYQLRTQMRVKAGSNFVSYVRWILNPTPTTAPPQIRDFGDYDFRLFDRVDLMRAEIFQRDAEVGLSRMAAGFAWPWKSKGHPDVFDIEIDGVQMQWNRTQTDWVSSPNALQEVGSIHTVQGYDLNYLGVIIGPDLRFDPAKGGLYIDRNSYHDKKGKENNPRLGRVYSDDDLLRFITQIYAVLLTRGIRGTYVYACDGGLRAYLTGFIPLSHDFSTMDTS